MEGVKQQGNDTLARDRLANNRCAPARASGQLTQRRAAELALAAMITGGALFSAFVTDALPQTALSGDQPTPTFDPADFARTDAADGSRAAVAAALSGSGSALRLAAQPGHTRQTADTEPGVVAQTRDVTVRARAAAPQAPGWSGSALGVQVTASTRELTDLPPVFLVGGAGRESYMIAPGGTLSYTFAPAGVEASVGDAHFGVGVELGRDVYATLGYVREQRRYRAGVREWREDEHYAGVALRARW